MLCVCDSVILCCVCVCVCSDDENRIVLEALPSEVAGEDGDDDYVNAYMGDYINASYVDVWQSYHV